MFERPAAATEKNECRIDSYAHFEYQYDHAEFDRISVKKQRFCLFIFVVLLSIYHGRTAEYSSDPVHLKYYAPMSTYSLQAIENTSVWMTGCTIRRDRNDRKFIFSFDASNSFSAIPNHSTLEEVLRGLKNLAQFWFVLDMWYTTSCPRRSFSSMAFDLKMVREYESITHMPLKVYVMSRFSRNHLTFWDTCGNKAMYRQIRCKACIKIKKFIKS